MKKAMPSSHRDPLRFEFACSPILLLLPAVQLPFCGHRTSRPLAGAGCFNNTHYQGRDSEQAIPAAGAGKRAARLTS
jgi:hypothetical protein